MDPVMQMLMIVAIKFGAVAEVAAFVNGLGFWERMAHWGVILARFLHNIGAL